jgi:queuine tRNA-ribosyltransferase
MKHFSINKKSKRSLARAGVIHTLSGEIKTPAFIPVGTRATVKGLKVNDLYDLGAQAILANTYHLHLRPGEKIIAKSGGLAQYMGANLPTFTDSGGFQAFSLGADLTKRRSKISAKEKRDIPTHVSKNERDIVHINDDGISFRSIYDGSKHFFTPESCIDIQRLLGADIIFSLDECPPTDAKHSVHENAVHRSALWGERCLARLNTHRKKDRQRNVKKIQFLYGIVQGGRVRELREASARLAAAQNYDGYGIGGSFDKEDIGASVFFVNSILPEDKPRHLLGIGEPEDILLAIKSGCDTFDCVAPTRMGRNGTLYTGQGKINITNSRFKNDFNSIDKECDCFTCTNHSRGYLHHLFRTGEMLAGVLGSIHNLRYIIRYVENIRLKIIDGKI